MDEQDKSDIITEDEAAAGTPAIKFSAAAVLFFAAAVFTAALAVIDILHGSYGANSLSNILQGLFLFFISASFFMIKKKNLLPLSLCAFGLLKLIYRGPLAAVLIAAGLGGGGSSSTGLSNLFDANLMLFGLTSFFLVDMLPIAILIVAAFSSARPHGSVAARKLWAVPGIISAISAIGVIANVSSLSASWRRLYVDRSYVILWCVISVGASIFLCAVYFFAAHQIAFPREKAQAENAAPSLHEALRGLKEMLDEALITQEDFDAKKKQMLRL